jgi:hypothetical protein
MKPDRIARAVEKATDSKSGISGYRLLHKAEVIQLLRRELAKERARVIRLIQRIAEPYETGDSELSAAENLRDDILTALTKGTR